MNTDIEKGLALKIEGELGKYHSLPIDTLIRIMQSLQQLVNAIALAEAHDPQGIDLEFYKLELSYLGPGSVIPEVRIQSRRGYGLLQSESHKRSVVKKVDKVLQLSDSRSFLELKKIFPDNGTRIKVVDSLYDFTHSFGTAPVYFGNRRKNGKAFSKAYKMYPLTKADRERLKVGILHAKVGREETATESFASVQVVRRNDKIIRKRIKQLYSNKDHELSYAPKIIEANDRTYELNFPLRCAFEKVDELFIIRCEPLDLFSTGFTEDEAEIDFSNEFDYLYRRLNSMDDNALSKRMMGIKSYFSIYVNKFNDGII